MFSLLYGFWQYLFQKDEFYIIILGLDNAGKTTLLEQAKASLNPNYKGVNLSKISCTVGLNIGKIASEGVILNFWDLGGQSELQCLWDKYFAESHGIIYVVDSSDIERIEESKLAFDKVMQNPTLAGVPLLFVANKQDVKECLSLDRIKEIFNINQLEHSENNANHNTNHKSREYHYVAVSALQGKGIKESIHWITESVKRNILDRPPTAVTE